MERQCANALELAKFLKQLDAGITVNYPGLCDSPYHELAKKQLHGGFGCILTESRKSPDSIAQSNKQG